MAYAESFRGGDQFRHNRETSQTSFAFAKTAWFCFTFLGSEGGGHGTVASPLGALVTVIIMLNKYKILLQVNTYQQLSDFIHDNILI